jgi:hypothetical protein
MLHSNFVTYHTLLKSGKAPQHLASATNADLVDIMLREDGAPSGDSQAAAPLSKKEKRLIKQQRQKETATKKKAVDSDEEGNDD